MNTKTCMYGAGMLHSCVGGIMFLCFLAVSLSADAQCVPPQPQIIQSTVGGGGDVTVAWSIPCPTSCTNAASTSTLFFIGFYSQESAAPNALDAEYGFTTFVAPGCFFTELWDGQFRDSSSSADEKESECISTLAGQESNGSPGFDKSFSLEDICNNNYGFGPGILQITFPAYAFCSGVTYDVKVWTIEVNVVPNGAITTNDIACNNLYLSESLPGVAIASFVYPGVRAPIAPPSIVVSGSDSSNGTYVGTHNRIVVDCIDTFSFDYQVTPGCNFTESVAAYFNVSQTYTYAQGIINPSDWGLGVNDWYIFFANNIFDGMGNPVPYVGNNQFASFVVTDDVEVCILTQDPCNGMSAATCLQFDVLPADTVLADFSYSIQSTNNCDSFEVILRNESTGATAYFWDFGDGTTSTSGDSALTHLFSAADTFQVTLRASRMGQCGGIDSVTQTLLFTPRMDTAVVTVSYSTVLSPSCDSLFVEFTATASVSVDAVYWDFGNGNTDTGFVVRTAYATPGAYPVTAYTSSASSCTVPDTVTNTVVFAPPTDTATASFTWSVVSTNGCDSTVVRFDNGSTSAVAYTWTFPDTVIATAVSGSITQDFSGNGPFVIELIALGGACSIGDTIRDTLSFVPVIDTIVVDFTHQDSFSVNCDSLIVVFAASVSDSARLQWDFGNGSTSTVSNPRMVYATPGVYTVSLTAIPTSPCTVGSTVTYPVTFSPSGFVATAAFSSTIVSSNECDTFVVQFTNQSVGGTGFMWDFGNGQGSTDTQPLVTYSSGTYPVTLEVIDTRNCARGDTAFGTVSLVPIVRNPRAALDTQVTVTCDAAVLSVTNESDSASGYRWYIDSIFAGNQASIPTMTFSEAVSVAIDLIALGGNSCSNDDTASIVVVVPGPYGYPSVGFDFSPVDPSVGQAVVFTNHSQGADDARYYWSFGDGDYATLVNPTHSYSQEGSYLICLQGENAFGCPDSACARIVIVPKDEEVDNVVDLPRAFTPNSDGRNDVFMVRGQNLDRIHLRIFNRWGEMVFESKNPKIGWDGTYRGELQEIEVYDWLLSAWFTDGSDVFKKGNVTLIR